MNRFRQSISPVNTRVIVVYKTGNYDIRDWSPDGKTMGKGVTLFKEKLATLRDLLNKIDE